MTQHISTLVLGAAALGLAVTTGFSAGPPSAVTSAATGITSNSATLNGTFTANGEATWVGFDLGLTTNYGVRLYLTTIDASASAVPLGGTVPNLTPGQTYHYRAVASNSFGVVVGGNASFTLLASVPLAITEPARDVTQTGALLYGQGSLRGAAGAVYFQWGTDTNYGQTAGPITLPDLVGTHRVTNAVSNLSLGLTYHYRLLSSNSVGVALGTNVTFTTGAAPPPTASTLPADNITAGGARLNGQANPNGSTTSVSFQYGTTTNYGTTVVLGSVGNGFSAVGLNVTVFGLQSGTLYHFRVVAQSAAGTNYGADLIFTTSGGPGLPPTATTLEATNITATSATVTGEANPNGSASSAYFEIGTTTNYGLNSFTVNVGSSSLPVSFSADFGGLAPATWYHYRLVAYNAHGTNFGADATFTTLGGTELTPSPVDTNLLASGHRVLLRQAAPGFGSLGNVTAAEALLALPATNAGVAFDAWDVGVATINYADLATSPSPQGFFGFDRDVHLLPGNLVPAGTDQNQYAMDVAGYLYLPQAGSWTFTVTSDEGFRLRMGESNGVVMEFPGPRAGGVSAEVVSIPAAGYYRYRLVYFERTNGSAVEFFARGPGQDSPMLVGDPFGTIRVYHDLEAPRLSIARQPGQVVVGWPLSAGLWTVQTRTNLAPASSWTTVAPAVGVVAGQYVLTNDATLPAQFIRLTRP